MVSQPRAGAKKTKVPWIIQDAFPGYHGVAWYWRDFAAPANQRPGGRYLLRFWAVDYKAEVWLNGVRVGEHEGGETPFVLDVTGAVKPDEANRLAVRVLNPTHEPIDGIVLDEDAAPQQGPALLIRQRLGPRRDHGIRSSCFGPGRAGRGPLRPAGLEDRGRSDPGQAVQALAGRAPSSGRSRVRVEVSIAPAASGETLAVGRIDRELPPGDTLVETQLAIANPHLWDLNDPFLYRVTARVTAESPALVDEHSVRCGFRDFRFRDGAFPAQRPADLPAVLAHGQLLPDRAGDAARPGLPAPRPDQRQDDAVQRDPLHCRRGQAVSARLVRRDRADGLRRSLCGLVPGRFAEDGGPVRRVDPRHDPPRPESPQRDDVGVAERNARRAGLPPRGGPASHPPHAGRFPHGHAQQRPVGDVRGGGSVARVGSLSNPGSTVWEDVLSDQHPYQRVPHTADIIRTLRTLHGNGLPVFLSEYGIGSAMDLMRIVKHYEQVGKTEVEDARLYRTWREQFLADYGRWRMEDTFAAPRGLLRRQHRAYGGPAAPGLERDPRESPRDRPQHDRHVGPGHDGEGLWTTFRELKPGTTDAVFDGWAPLRWCLFVEPANVYRKTPVRLEAVLANEDALLPGKYPARLEVVGPDATRVWEQDGHGHNPRPSRQA